LADKQLFSIIAAKRARLVDTPLNEGASPSSMLITTTWLRSTFGSNWAAHCSLTSMFVGLAAALGEGPELALELVYNLVGVHAPGTLVKLIYVVRRSMALRPPVVFCATCGVTSCSHNLATTVLVS
jgi:hypothetical protein